MQKAQTSLHLLTNMPRVYYAASVLIGLLLFYWIFLSQPSSGPLHADITSLPQSSLFNYTDVSQQVYFTETQGILYVPPQDQLSHFVSLKANGVRGNHRHKDPENKVAGEVIILLQGRFLFRIGDGDTNQYEDYEYDISKTGIVAVQFSADKCHGLKNIGSETNWFTSYYIKVKELVRAAVDREACSKMMLT